MYQIWGKELKHGRVSNTYVNESVSISYVYEIESRVYAHNYIKEYVPIVYNYISVCTD